MNTSLNSILQPLSSIFSQDFLRKASGQNILLPFYHSVSDHKLQHIQDDFYHVRNISTFEADLDYCAKNYRAISLDELYRIISSEKPSREPVFHISFDDGLREVYDIVLPILKNKKIPASVFINTDFVDNKGLFYKYKIGVILDRLQANPSASLKLLNNVHDRNKYSSTQELKDSLLAFTHDDESTIDSIASHLNINWQKYLQDQKPYMSSTQIKELMKNGFEIGSHGYNHRWFKYLTLDEKKEQITRSFDYLSEELGIAKQYFSFPFSDENVSPDFFDWLLGDFGCKLSFGISGLKSDYHKNHLHRLPMENNLNEVSKIIKTEYLYFMIKSLFGKNKISR